MYIRITGYVPYCYCDGPCGGIGSTHEEGVGIVSQLYYGGGAGRGFSFGGKYSLKERWVSGGAGEFVVV